MTRFGNVPLAPRRPVALAVVAASMVLLSAGPAFAQTPLPQIVSLSIDPVSPQAGQAATMHVVCDHSGPVALDDIDVAATIDGGATPNDFQDDVASNGGVDWTSRTTSPMPGGALRADRVGVFTWNGTGPGTITVRCSSSHGLAVGTLGFSGPEAPGTGPPGTGPASVAPSFSVVDVPTAPGALARTGGRPHTAWIALPTALGALLIVAARGRRSTAGP
jgi:hypothetical protein